MELKNYFAQNAAGDLLPGAVATLYLAATTTLASGLKTAAGAALANPVTADADGLIQFAAPNGLYDMKVTAPGRSYTVRIQCIDVTEAVTAAEGSALAALTSSQRATTAAELAKVGQIADTYADAHGAAWSVPDGGIVRVLADETQGNRSSWYRAHTSAAGSGPSLALDFIGAVPQLLSETLSLDFIAGRYSIDLDPSPRVMGTYSVVGETLEYVTGDGTRLVSVPTKATAAGTLGDIAISATHIYVATGANIWRRAALETF
ncbi:hypothetical protein [Pseudomonas sp. C9-3]|uniref:hypothetical protein n=1 Tax=Pseudomonas sp. C9-3 TaxID=3078264 RepID=UPI0028E32CE8|nr:hypothetical protein [Pseudomonas sp. C9-3]